MEWMVEQYFCEHLNQVVDKSIKLLFILKAKIGRGRFNNLINILTISFKCRAQICKAQQVTYLTKMW
jgi:hypothetical protein